MNMSIDPLAALVAIALAYTAGLAWLFRVQSVAQMARDGVARVERTRETDKLSFDARLAWRWRDNLEISIVGQNLWDDQHPEFGAGATREEIPRSVFGKVAWSF